MLKFRDFLTSGYREHKTYRGDRMCQRAIKTATPVISSSGARMSSTKLYFINVYYWDHRNYGVNKVGLEAEAVFYHSEDEWFTVNYHAVEEKDSVEQVEQFFKNMYESMRCVPDAHNND